MTPRDALRPLTLFIATSLDGHIARPDGRVDWLFHDQDYGFAAFFDTVDTVVMGRRTYEHSLSFGEYPYPDRRAFVFTRTPRLADGHAAFVTEPVGPFVAALKRQPGGVIWLVGGADIVAECVRHDLVDRYDVFVHPVVLGAGIPLFPAGLPEQRLALSSAERFGSGLVRISYERAP